MQMCLHFNYDQSAGVLPAVLLSTTFSLAGDLLTSKTAVTSSRLTRQSISSNLISLLHATWITTTATGDDNESTQYKHEN